MNNQNFLNLLHLEEGEQITHGFNGNISISNFNQEEQIIEQGIFFICSKSFAFKTNKQNSQLYRFPLKNFIGLEQQRNSFRLSTSKIIVIKLYGPASPYNFFNFKKQQKPQIIINIDENIQQKKLLDWINYLKEIQTNDYNIEDPQFEIIHSLIEKFPNVQKANHNLNLFKEQLKMTRPFFAKKILPLVQQYCLINLTNKNIYIYDIVDYKEKEILKIPYENILNLYKRRFQLQPTCIEIDTQQDSYVINFEKKESRDIFYQKIEEEIDYSKTQEDSLENLTQQWVNRAISNFDYLMKLNKLSNRSFNDLTQYPVFPWLLINFDSKEIDIEDPQNYRDLKQPIGALNKQRLQFFLNRYKNMPSNNKFMYGTHYSSPGYAIGYLFRKYPQWMLHLQSGKFDSPDRLFYSIEQDWKICYNHNGCVKELIPEFYMNDTSFLENKQFLELGRMQTGEVVNNVQLPIWASNTQQFLEINRNALESEYTSKNIHHWIDLIFGYKQNGIEAEKSNNVFIDTSYEGVVELHLIEQIYERKAILTQINEYGQTPKQLFKNPHPQRKQKEQIFKELNIQIKNNKSNKNIVIKKQLENLPSKISYQKISEKNYYMKVKQQKLFQNYLYFLYQKQYIKILDQDLEELKSFRIYQNTINSFDVLNEDKIGVGTNDNKFFIFNTKYGFLQNYNGNIDSCIKNIHFLKKQVNQQAKCNSFLGQLLNFNFKFRKRKNRNFIRRSLLSFKMYNQFMG